MTLSPHFVLIRAFLLFLFLTACQRQPALTHSLTPTLLAITPSLAPSATPGIYVEARAYLDQALEIMEQHSLFRQEINWKRFTRNAYSLAGSAATPSDTYPAIQLALNNLMESVYTLKAPLPPVAVLTGQRTSSSGEALMVAFRGRPLARSFGRETLGLSTANEVYTLSDGALIYLTEAHIADRTGRVYGGIITPDEYIRDDTSTSDTVLEKASAWLLKQDRCLNQP